jgi:DNA-binding transcriptional LysR family regulator
MELSLLKLFCNTVEKCPIFYVEDPFPLETLVQALSPVETFFGANLLILNEKKLDVTQAGKILYPLAKEVLNNVEEAMSAVRSTNRGDAVLFVGACTGSGNSFLVSALGEYKNVNPEHHLVLRLNTSSAIIEQIQSGLLELGISGYQFHDAELEYKEILEDELIIIVPPEHAFAEKDVVHLGEILTEPFIMEQKGSGSRETLLEALSLNDIKLSDLNVVMEVGLHESVKAAVISGLGISILPWLSVEKDIQSAKLHAIRLREGRMVRKFYLTTRKNAALSPVAQSFYKFLLNRY